MFLAVLLDTHTQLFYVMPLISEKKDSLIRVCTCNHIFGRVIWNKFYECSFENFQIAIVKRGQFQNFWKIIRMIYPLSWPNQNCGRWFITPNQQTHYIETNIL